MKVFKTKMVIDRLPSDLWAIITDTDSWGHWYDSAIETVEPGWQPGAFIRFRNKETWDLKELKPSETLLLISRFGEKIEWNFANKEGKTIVTTVLDLTESSEFGIDPEKKQRKVNDWLTHFNSHAIESAAPKSAKNEGPCIFNAEALIGQPRTKVWAIFTDPSTWRIWYGGDLKKVEPRWEPGAILHWGIGPTSKVVDIEKETKVKISSSGGITSLWSFQDSPQGTLVKLVLDYSASNLAITDRTAVQQRCLSHVNGLKRYIDSMVDSPRQDKSNIFLPKKPWWKFWKYFD